MVIIDPSPGLMATTKKAGSTEEGLRRNRTCPSFGCPLHLQASLLTMVPFSEVAVPEDSDFDLESEFATFMPLFRPGIFGSQRRARPGRLGPLAHSSDPALGHLA